MRPRLSPAALAIILRPGRLRIQRGASSNRAVLDVQTARTEIGDCHVRTLASRNSRPGFFNFPFRPTRRSPSANCAAMLSSSRSIQPIGAPFAAISWPFTTRFTQNSRLTAPNSSASPSMARIATLPTPRTASSNSRCSPTSEAEGRCLQSLRSLLRTRRLLQRTRALRHRQRRHHPLELPLAHRRQSWRGRHPRSFRSTTEIGPDEHPHNPRQRQGPQPGQPRMHPLHWSSTATTSALTALPLIL